MKWNAVMYLNWHKATDEVLVKNIDKQGVERNFVCERTSVKPQLASNLALNTKLFSLGHESNMLFFNWSFSEVLLRAIIKEVKRLQIGNEE